MSNKRNQESIDPNSQISAPVPIRKQANVNSIGGNVGAENQIDFRSLTPNTTRRVTDRRPSYNSIEVSRELSYNLDYPEDPEEVLSLQIDPQSRFFARERPRTLNLPKLLPYETELPKDQAKFLSHIVSHLYIAIKTLDVQGSLSVTAKDLASLRNVSGLSDLDIALETNLFEINGDHDYAADDDASNYFSVDEYADSDSEYDDEENDEEEGMDGEEDKNENESVVQHKKSPKSAAVVGVRIWTNELLVWLKMKYDMPLTLRIALSRVYYAICLCRGQYINLKIYVKTFELLTKDVQLLRKKGLKLDSKDLLNELNNHFNDVDASVDSIEKKDHKQLLRLAERASNFYDPEVLPVIFDSLGKHLSVSNPALAICSMSAMPLVFSNDGPSSIYDSRHYISTFFYIWAKFKKSHDLDSHLTSRLGTIVMSFLTEVGQETLCSKEHLLKNFGIYGILNHEQIELLLSNLLNSLSILKEKFGSTPTNFFHGYVSALVYSINGSKSLEKDGILENIANLLNAIESYVHPTNTGPWTKMIAKFVYSFIYQFHKRFNQENEKDGLLANIPEEVKLNKEVVDKVVSIFLPIVKTGLQSKKSSAVDTYLSSLNLLAFLDSPVVLEAVLLDIYESLEGVISTHRVIVAIRTLDELARYFASTKIFRVHLTRLLSLAVPGIDSNDLEKTLLTLSLFQTVANFVPFHDLNNEMSDENLVLTFTQAHIEYLQDKIYRNFQNESIFSEEVTNTFEVSEELEIQALKSSSSLFLSLTKSLIQRVFTLLENIPDPNKSGRYEKAIADALPKYLYIIFESMSDKIFKQIADMIFEFVFDNTIHTVAEVIAEVCGAVTKREPMFFKRNAPLLMSKIREEIEENSSGASRTGVDIVPRDQPLFWYLIILNECIGNSGSHVIDIWDDLKDLIYFLMDHVKGPTVFAASYIVNQSLQALVKIKIKELRLMLPKFIEEHGVDESCWGGFQFDENRFSTTNFDFDWHLPTEKEVDCALNLFTDMTSKVLGNILSLMLSYTKDSKREGASLDFTDDLRNNFLYLSYALSGISFLFDPSFEEDIPKLSQHQNETIQQRLLLLKQIRSVKDETNKGTDELRIENLQENLQKIIDDMSNEELIRYDHDLDKETDDMDIEKDKDHGKDERFAASPTPSLITKGLESSKNDLFSFDRGDTESPDLRDSGHRASPGIEGVAISQMNPGITFRERKLYTSRYFFGDDMETRRSSESYIKLHRYRYLIGRSLHIICKFLTNHFHDNTKLFKNYLYLLNIWLSDVGRERLLDHSHIKVNYGFISATQSINRIHKPFTRLAFGSRIEAYHLLRVALHATSRTQTDLDKLLLEDLVKLSVSNYSAVAKAAQSTLIEAMKRLNGSYNVIIRSSLRYLSKALEEESVQKIESGLNLFNLKRIKNKVQNDYFNLQKYLGLLHRCLLIDSVEVNDIAYALFKGVYGNLTPPSSVCLIDLESIDTIRPPDAFIDLEIKAVKLAKEKKREIYLDKLRKLENSIVLNEQSSSYWKLSSLNMSLLIGLQFDWEIPTNDEVLRLLANEASSDHPMISRLALKGITKILNKIYIQQLMDYKLDNIYDLNYVTRDTKFIDCHVKGSFYSKWRQEMENTNRPSYFIDHKVDNGWLFWSDKLKVVVPEPSYQLSLNEKDDAILKSFANCITKLWFHNIVKLWVTDNEANTAYQATDVYLTFSIILLISNGLVKELSFDDILKIVEDIYERDDKSSHIVVCEILAGILISSKHLTNEMIEKRDLFMLKFLYNILNNDITPDTSGIWNVFSWWVPSHIDVRRFPEITNMIMKFKLDKDSDSAIKDSTRLTFMRSFVAAVTWRLQEPDHVIDMCLQNINHQYQAVRDQIGSLLAMTSFVYYPDSIEDSKTFTEMCFNGTIQAPYSNKIKEVMPGVFKSIENWRLQVLNKSPQEILNSNYIYASTTVLTWLKQAFLTNVSEIYEDFVVPYIVPFLLGLTNMKEVCQLGNIDPITVLKLASQITFNHENASQVVAMLKEYSSEKSLTVVQSIIIGEFTETFYFKNLMKLDALQRAVVINFTNELLYHKQVSVREAAASTLSGLIHISPPGEVEDLIKKYSQQYKKNLDRIRKRNRKTGFAHINVEDSIILHGSTLGLGSLIHAFSFLSPPPVWVPELLTILANKSTGIPGVVGKTAKESLGKFKKTRQDTWHIDSKVFNESQMQDLEGVLLKSYFI